MTLLDKIDRASVAQHPSAAVSGRHLAIELAETLKLAVPLALTQLGQIAMMTTDIALIGRLGSEAMAAAALAHTVFFVSFTVGLAWSILPALWFMAIRGFMSAINRPDPILWITLGAIPANALLVYLLLYGAFGFPELGLFGAGLATSIVNLGTFVAAAWFAARRR